MSNAVQTTKLQQHFAKFPDSPRAEIAVIAGCASAVVVGGGLSFEYYLYCNRLLDREAWLMTGVNMAAWGGAASLTVLTLPLGEPPLLAGLSDELLLESKRTPQDQLRENAPGYRRALAAIKLWKSEDAIIEEAKKYVGLRSPRLAGQVGVGVGAAFAMMDIGRSLVAGSPLTPLALLLPIIGGVALFGCQSFSNRAAVSKNKCTLDRCAVENLYKIHDSTAYSLQTGLHSKVLKRIQDEVCVTPRDRKVVEEIFKDCGH